MKHAAHRRSIRVQNLVLTALLSVGLCLIAGTLMAQEVKVTSLMSQVMTDVSGKEGLLITVEYPPGGSDPVHRHNAHAFVYVLEGSVVMQVKGGKQVTLTPGQTFYEGSTFISLAGTRAKPSRQNSLYSWSRTRTLPCSCQ